MRAFVGVDIGGTKVSTILWSRGKILDRSVVPSPSKTTEEFEEKVLGSVNEVCAHARKTGYEPAAIGIGCAGLVDQSKGLFLFPTNIPGVHEVALAGFLAAKTGLPAYLENDANCALFAEWVDGVAKGYRNVIFFIVGTGVGGGFILDNHLYIGRHGFAGEIGHFPVVETGLRCGCKGHGCLETISSGTGIQRYAQNALRHGAQSSMSLEEAGSAKAIAEYARKGDPVAQRAFHRAAHYLGRTIGGLINLFDPDMIILGGGVPDSGLILDEVIRTAQKRSMPLLYEGVRIVTAQYKNDAGSIGAALLAQYLAEGRQVYSA